MALIRLEENFWWSNMSFPLEQWLYISQRKERHSFICSLTKDFLFSLKCEDFCHVMEIDKDDQMTSIFR